MTCFHLRAKAGGEPRRRALAAGSLALCLLLGGAPTAPAQEPAAPEPAAPESAGFQVIVHDDISQTRLPAKTVANMFLKKTKRWESGEFVVPVDLEPKHPTRELFTRAVHKKSVTAVVSYWQRIIFSKGGSPPESRTSEEDVLAFVAATPGAIGYVSDDVELGDGVRKVSVDERSNP